MHLTQQALSKNEILKENVIIAGKIKEKATFFTALFMILKSPEPVAMRYHRVK